MLHRTNIPESRYTLIHNGQNVLKLNAELLTTQNVWTNVDLLLSLHSERLHLEDIMKDVVFKIQNNQTMHYKFWQELISELQLYNEYYDLIEYELQDAWNFKRDSSYFRFWERPGCSCPILDNLDSYPSKHKNINGGCFIHGYKYIL